MHASWCTEIHVAPASANDGMNSSGLSIIRWQSKMVSGKALRSEATTGGPMVRFGTKCPSMMSTCSSVPPPSSACLACAAKFAKFADKIEGASSITRGKVHAPQPFQYKHICATTLALPDNFMPQTPTAARCAFGCSPSTVPERTSPAALLHHSLAAALFRESSRATGHRNRDSRLVRLELSPCSVFRPPTTSASPNRSLAQRPNFLRLRVGLYAATLPADRALASSKCLSFLVPENAAVDR